MHETIDKYVLNFKRESEIWVYLILHGHLSTLLGAKFRLVHSVSLVTFNFKISNDMNTR